MNILLSNDDGIKADGLRILAEHLKAAGHNLLIIAPSRERSATSHAATFGRPLYMEEYHGIISVRAFSLSGKPADCVKFGSMQFPDFKIDLVISGINRGQNIGTDIIYSGTVSAAQEGALLGINSIAVSCEYNRDRNTGKYVYESKQIEYNSAAEFITVNLPFFIRHAAPDTFFNVNIPGSPPKGVKLIKHGHSKYNDYYEKRTDENGKEYFVLLGEHAEDGIADKECDVRYFGEGYITITPIFYSRTNFEKLKEMEKDGAK